VLAQIKAQVPYLFRYDVPPDHNARPLKLNNVPRTARDLAIAAALTLGSEWQLMLFHNGFTLYLADRTYEYGTELYP
jgi:hypothetical protein